MLGGAALLLSLVLVVVNYSCAPSAAFRLVHESGVVRVPAYLSHISTAKDLCSWRSVNSALHQFGVPLDPMPISLADLALQNCEEG